jgi:hypothetical protein
MTHRLIAVWIEQSMWANNEVPMTASAVSADALLSEAKRLHDGVPII